MMRAVPQEDLNVASGVFMMFMMIGNTLSIILSAGLSFFLVKRIFYKAAKSREYSLTAQQHQDLVNIISKVEHSASQLKDFPPEQIPQLLNWVNEAFVYGLSLNMMFGTLLALIATGLTIKCIGSFKAPSSSKPRPDFFIEKQVTAEFFSSDL